MASSDNWLSSFYFYGAGVWPGSRNTVVKNGWRRGENPHIHFWKHFLPSLNAGVGVGCAWSCPASHQAPKYQSSVPLSGEGGTRHKSTDLRESKDDKELQALTQHCPGGTKAFCSDTLILCQWVRPITDPALLSCWAALVVLTWHVSTSSKKQHLNYVKCLPRD